MASVSFDRLVFFQRFPGIGSRFFFGQVLDQGFQHFLGHAHHVFRGIFADDVVKEILFGLHQTQYLFLIPAGGHHGEDLHLSRLAEAMDP